VTSLSLAQKLADQPAEATGAFVALYDEHFSFVWRCLRGLGVAAAQLEDATQDVFVTVHRRLGTLQDRAALRPWIFGIVRRVAYRYRRSLARRKTEPEPSQ
jgi:RNA polymerase sigma-70 factor (ECF subfamily)